ncbi:MAG: addiction module protein [Xanthomonadales bacterium]|nr:addiction module protein [Xanthomonadales bacterium]
MNVFAASFHGLSISERIQLVEDLWDSIASEAPGALGLTPAQGAEIQRRLAAHDTDPSTAVDWDAVRSELQRRDQ